MAYLSETSRITSLQSDLISRLNQSNRLTTPNTLQQGSSQQPAQFSTSANYASRQGEMLNFLQQLGLNQGQINTLSQLGNLSFDQFSRVVLIAQSMDKNPQLFDQFVKNVKNIETRGRHVESGIKNYLDGFDEILGFDSHKVIEDLMSRYQSFKQQSDGGDNALLKQFVDQGQELEALPQEVKEQFKQVKSVLEKQFQTTSLETTKDFLAFAHHSIEEFPERYQIDLFAYSQLKQKGVSLEDYLSLSSEISPTRLLNLLIAADKNQKTAASLVLMLHQAQQRGEPLEEILTNLESQMGIVWAKTMNAQNTLPLIGKLVTIEQGENLILSFLALDSQDGLLASEKNSFVLFPQRLEYAGQDFNLAQLPLGMYLLLAMSQNSRNETINLWTKVIVKEKVRKEEESEKDEQQNSKKEQQQPKQNAQDNPVAEQKDFVTTDFTSSANSLIGPFLGEIVLPLDYLNREAQDLIVMSPHTGMILDRDEFLNGRFFNHAVSFRFLTNLVNPLDIKERHHLIHLKDSPIFSKYNEELNQFVKNPELGLVKWQAALKNFFAQLSNLFPVGSKTFAIAEELFLKESEAFAKGEDASCFYKTSSLEKEHDKFLAAFYAKGAYAMASAGEVSGSLHGLSCAVLTDLSDDNQKAVLGEYLEDVKNHHLAKTKDENMQNIYGMHISHNFADKLLANPYYKEQGESFIKVIDLKLDVSLDETAAQPSTAYGYGIYR